MAFDDIDTPATLDELEGVTETDEQEAANAAAGEPGPEPAIEPQPPEAKADESKPEREQSIPRARFDELNAKLHAEREEAARLRDELAQLKQPKAPDVAIGAGIEAMEQEFFDAMMEGDKDKAVAIRAKINAQIYATAESSSVEKVARNLSEREAQSAFLVAAQQAIAAYPFLDIDSVDANDKAINEVVEWRDFYVAKGDSLAVALQKAADKVGPMYSGGQKTPESRTDARKQAALARNLADSARQAPAVDAGIGNRAVPLPKVATQRDWEKLSQSERDEILMG